MKTRFLILVIFMAACQAEQKQAPLKKIVPVEKTDSTGNGNEINCSDNDTTEKQYSHSEDSIIYMENYYSWPNRTYNWKEKNGPGTFFYSGKVDSMLSAKRKKRNSDLMADEFDVIRQKQLLAFTTKELIYYCLAHPCAFSQNCAGLALPNNGKMNLALYLPSSESAKYLSELQAKSLSSRKDSVCYLLTEALCDVDTIDIDYLDIIIR